MVESSAAEIRQLHRGDVDAALKLQAAEGWNQTERDWHRLLQLEPQGCFAAWLGGRLVGTITTISYGKGLGWIGMMLVDSAHRRRGIATQLMQAGLDHLQAAGITNIKLDATPAGRPLYESLGFRPEIVIERWCGIARPSARVKGLKSFDEADMQRLWEFDVAAFATNRGALLKNLVGDSLAPPLLAEDASGRLLGFALSRAGGKAAYIGPIVACEETTALTLLDGILAALENENVYLDFHAGFHAGTEALADRGFSKQRDLLRMQYGTKIHPATSALIFGIAGPELG